MAESVVSLGGVPHLTTMLMSSHVRMLNEAIIALTVMAAVLGEDAVHAQERYSTIITNLVLEMIFVCIALYYPPHFIPNLSG